jgi:hypothetical protein
MLSLGSGGKTADPAMDPATTPYVHGDPNDQLQRRDDEASSQAAVGQPTPVPPGWCIMAA